MKKISSLNILVLSSRFEGLKQLSIPTISILDINTTIDKSYNDWFEYMLNFISTSEHDVLGIFEPHTFIPTNKLVDVFKRLFITAEANQKTLFVTTNSINFINGVYEEELTNNVTIYEFKSDSNKYLHLTGKRYVELNNLCGVDLINATE